MNANKSERRQRVAIIRRVLRFPEMIENIHQYMGSLRWGQDPLPADKLRHLEDKMREAVNYIPRFKSELRVLFNRTSPSEDTRRRFDEVYDAFEREATACFNGLLQLQMYLHRGLEVPVEGGGTASISFRTLYGVIDIDEAKSILKMAAEEIAQCFPVDEAEEAEHATGFVIEEYVVGDKFENITNSTIVNRSQVEHAFNRTEARLGDEVASAIVEIAQLIDQSGNAAAGAVFDEFTAEVDKDQPDKSKLRQCWDGLVAILPSIVTVAGAGETIARLFS
jgi:hypothetical protein